MLAIKFQRVGKKHQPSYRIVVQEKKHDPWGTSLEILGKFRLNGHIDPDLFDIFVRRKVYLRYAKEFLDPKQIDTVDEAAIPGFAP